MFTGKKKSFIVVLIIIITFIYMDYFIETSNVYIKYSQKPIWIDYNNYFRYLIYNQSVFNKFY